MQVVETYFNSDRAIEILDELADEMRPEMERQIAKWHKPSSIASWDSALDSLREIIRARPANALEQVRKFFGASQDTMDTLVEKYKMEDSAAASQREPSTGA